MMGPELHDTITVMANGGGPLDVVPAEVSVKNSRIEVTDIGVRFLDVAIAILPAELPASWPNARKLPEGGNMLEWAGASYWATSSPVPTRVYGETMYHTVEMRRATDE